MDATTVSGADFKEDGRGFVLLDFDQDGWMDLGVVSTGEPRFRLVRNRFGEMFSNHGSVWLKLIGGCKVAESQSEWSSRDAYGATVTAFVGSTKRIFQLSCGEGLSSQNTSQIHIGLGAAQQIDKLKVDWPSGKQTVIDNISANSRRIIYENPQDADGEE